MLIQLFIFTNKVSVCVKNVQMKFQSHSKKVPEKSHFICFLKIINVRGTYVPKKYLEIRMFQKRYILFTFLFLQMLMEFRSKKVRK